MMSATQEPMPGARAPLTPTGAPAPRPYKRHPLSGEGEPVDEVPAISADAPPDPTPDETTAAGGSATPDAGPSPDVDASDAAASIASTASDATAADAADAAGAPVALQADVHAHDNRYGALLAAGLGVLGIGGAASHSGTPPPIAAIDPPKPDQPKSDPPVSEQKPDPGTSKPTGPDQPAPDQPETDQPKPDQPAPDQPQQPDPGKPDPGKPNPGKPDPGKPDPGKPDPGKPDPGTPDPGTSDPDPTSPADPDPKPPAHVPAAPRLALANDTGRSDHDLVTASGAVDVSGLEAGATLAVSVDGGKTWTSHGGDARLPDALFTADGAQHLAVKQIDATGNEGVIADLSFVLDRQAPDAPRWTMPIDKPALGAADVIALQGVEADALVEYRTDAAAPWLIAPDGQIPTARVQRDGTTPIEVRQSDVAGNVSATSTLVANVDLTAPAAPTLSLQKDTGLSDHDLITSSGSVIVSGLEPGGTLAFSLDGGKTWTPRGGDAVLPDALFSTDGPQQLQVKQIDASGNESAATTLFFVLDQSAPAALHWTMPADRPALGLDDIITVPGTEPDARVEFQLVNHPLAPWYGAYEGQIPRSMFHGDGTPYIAVRQTDVAGNVSPETVLWARLDLTPPVAPTLVLLNDTGASSTDGIASSGDVRVGGLEPGATLLVSRDGGDWNEWAAGTTVVTEDALLPVRATVQVKQVDAAGNVGEAATLTFTLDQEALIPKWTSSSLQRQSGAGLPDQVTFNAQDDLTISLHSAGARAQDTLSYRIDGGAWREAPGDGRLATSLFGSDGKHVLDLRETDLAGNVGLKKIQLTLDTTPPSAPVLSLLDDDGVSATDRVSTNPIVVVGGRQPGDTFQYRINGGDWIVGQNVEGGMIEELLTSPDGTYTVQVSLIDAAGNVGPSSPLTLHYQHAGAVI